MARPLTGAKGHSSGGGAHLVSVDMSRVTQAMMDELNEGRAAIPPEAIRVKDGAEAMNRTVKVARDRLDKLTAAGKWAKGIRGNTAWYWKL